MQAKHGRGVSLLFFYYQHLKLMKNTSFLQTASGAIVSITDVLSLQPVLHISGNIWYRITLRRGLPVMNPAKQARRSKTCYAFAESVQQAGLLAHGERS
jgi:hypothetical protein